MANKRKDGLPSKRSTGRKSKAQELGLSARMADAYRFISKNKVKEGATAVIEHMWKIALDKDHAKQFEALKWITDRYYGKEPQALVVEHNHNHKAVDLQKLITDAFKPADTIIDITPETDSDQPDLQGSNTKQGE